MFKVQSQKTKLYIERLNEDHHKEVALDREEKIVFLCKKSKPCLSSDGLKIYVKIKE